MSSFGEDMKKDAEQAAAAYYASCKADSLRAAEKVREACEQCIVLDGNPALALERIRSLDLTKLLEED